VPKFDHCVAPIPPANLGLSKIVDLQTTILSLAIYSCPKLQESSTLYVTSVCCEQQIETTVTHNPQATLQQVTQDIIKTLLEVYVNQATEEVELLRAARESFYGLN